VLSRATPSRLPFSRRQLRPTTTIPFASEACAGANICGGMSG
jgi:hypothetical protein